jgi:hypothetical protein
VTFLAKPDAIKALDSQVGGAVIRHARWEIVGSTVTLRTDGTYPTPSYEGNAVAYVDKLNLDASTFPLSSYTPFEPGEMSVTFDTVTKNALSGWVAVDPGQSKAFLNDVSDEHKGDVDKKFPVTCNPHK